MFGRDTKDQFVKPSQVESIVAAMAKVGIKIFRSKKSLDPKN